VGDRKFSVRSSIRIVEPEGTRREEEDIDEDVSAASGTTNAARRMGTRTEASQRE